MSWAHAGRLTPEQALDVCVARALGESVRSLASRHDVTPSAIYKILKAGPRQPRLLDAARIRFSVDIIARIDATRRPGENRESAAARLILAGLEVAS